MRSSFTVTTARELIVRLGAPPRLVQHAVLVGEAAELVLEALSARRIPVDADFVRLGVVFHDAGKILHADELERPGHEHEPAGERLLLDAGVEPRVAHCCVSHARWDEDEVSFEERLVALADKLWKGKREPDLEKRVVEEAAARAGRAFWDLFTDLDERFEAIAATGDERLARSVRRG